MRDPEPFDGHADALGDADRRLELDARQKRQEFLAAGAEGKVGDETQFGAGAGGDALEAGVAAPVAIAIVERLEMIDVEDDRRDRTFVARAGAPEIRGLLVQEAPVAQPGQRIVVGVVVAFGGACRSRKAIGSASAVRGRSACWN